MPVLTDTALMTILIALQAQLRQFADAPSVVARTKEAIAEIQNYSNKVGTL